MKSISNLFIAFSFLLILSFSFGCVSSGKTNSSGKDELELVIREATDYINGQVPKGNKLAILNITSGYQPLSGYIISELNANIVNDHIFNLVDRQQLDAIREEQNFQLSGEVDDNSAQALGKLLGAQTIITGSVGQIGKLWRIQLRALEVQTAKVQGQYNKNIVSVGIIADLTSESAKSGSTTASGSGFLISDKSTKPTENPVITSIPAQSTPTPTATLNQTYEVGDTGPAGGTIFYDKGTYSDGWRYLEFAPDDFRSVYWGVYGLDITGTETGIGSGKKNTELIIRVLNRRGEKGMAAQLCSSYILNSYNDWFLPSKDELNLLYTYLKENVLLDSRYGFNGWYYSSSQLNTAEAWGQVIQMSHTYQGGYRKNISGGLVRAIRSF